MKLKKKFNTSDPTGSVINWPPGSASKIQDNGSADPKEIFADPQHRKKLTRRVTYFFLKPQNGKNCKGKKKKITRQQERTSESANFSLVITLKMLSKIDIPTKKNPVTMSKKR
jgi:hypothetical protein